MLVNGPDAAKIAASGHGNLRLPETAQQGTDQIIGGANLPGHVVVGPGGVDAAAVDLHRVAVDAADTGTQVLQDFQAKGNVGDLGDVFDAADAVHQKGGGDDGNSGILCAADLYFSKQGFSALYNIFRQDGDPLFKRLTAVGCALVKTVCPSGGASYRRPAYGDAAAVYGNHTAWRHTHTLSIAHLTRKCKRFLLQDTEC